jgi:hypothetical protein
VTIPQLLDRLDECLNVWDEWSLEPAEDGPRATARECVSALRAETERLAEIIDRLHELETRRAA